MHPNAQLIERFYFAFQNRDYQAMVDCYTDDVTFADPIFQELHGWEARAMWRMLCEAASDLKITCSNVSADDTQGSAHWEAVYTFSRTKRLVHNKIDAKFEFSNGKIRVHRDTFDLWRWLRMATGATGILLGWTSALQNIVRNDARKNLQFYIQKYNLAPAGQDD